MSQRLVTLVGFSFVFFVGPAQAEIVSQTSLELQIQQKIYSVVKPIDESAIVITNLGFKKMDVDLPGLGSSLHELFKNPTVDEIVLEDVDRVQVRIISQLNPFPDSLKNLVNGAIKIDNTKINYTFELMDDALTKLTRKSEPAVPGDKQAPFAQNFKDAFKGIENNLSLGLFLLAGGFLILLGFIYAFFSIREKKNQAFWKQISSRLGESFGDIRVPTVAGVSAVKPFAQPRSQNSEGSSNLQIRELSALTLRAVFSDCYWCEKDNYAAWLWSMISSEQRVTLLREWPLGHAYVSFIAGFDHEVLTEHLQVCYLAPPDFSLVSQLDLAQWVRKNPGSWSQLSTIRRAHLTVSLKEKIIFAQQTHLKSTTLPQASSQSRNFGPQFEAGNLTESDELQIFNEPEFVPDDFKRKITSLVWVALLPLEVRREVLEEFSAQSLAEAWIGPDIVLEKLEQALTEKKRTLLQGYVKTTPGSRNSDVAKLLAQKALSRRGPSNLQLVKPA